MINAEIIREAEQRRLAWRCRRGMLELDIVLQRFITAHFNQLTLDQLQAFDAMLDLPDNKFWDLIQGVQTAKDKLTVSVLTMLQMACIDTGKGAA
jgi:antitoxin CptB